MTEQHRLTVRDAAQRSLPVVFLVFHSDELDIHGLGRVPSLSSQNFAFTTCSLLGSSQSLLSPLTYHLFPLLKH